MAGAAPPQRRSAKAPVAARPRQGGSTPAPHPALAVTHRGFRVGVLEAGADGVTFSYDPKWLATSRAFPLSLTMPLTAEPWPAAVVGPWIGNLLPEEGVLKAFAHALGVSAADAFGILAAAGADTAGAFSFAPIDEDRAGAAHLELFEYVGAEDAGADDAAFAALIDGLARKPFFADAEGVRLSLAGGQVKTALTGLDAAGWPTASLTPARFVVPMGEAASTVILKPDNPRLLGIVEIEAYGLELARRVGLPAADARIMRAGGRLALLVARYDRLIEPPGGRVRDPAQAVRRLHQEDFCQLAGAESWRKYEHATGGGVSLADLFAGARRHLAPRDLLRFLDYVIFNILVGNTDAHAKNYSVIVTADGATLAPLYDICSSLAWDHVNQRHAQKLAGRARRPVDIRRRHWETIAEASGLNPRETVRRVDELAARAVAAMVPARDAVAAQPGATEAVVADIAARIDAHVQRIQGGLA